MHILKWILSVSRYHLLLSSSSWAAELIIKHLIWQGQRLAGVSELLIHPAGLFDLLIMDAYRKPSSFPIIHVTLTVELSAD